MNDRNTQAAVKKPPPAPPRGDVLVADNPWKPMESAPQDGSYVYLKGDVHDLTNEFVNEWYWYKTRKYMNHHWVPCGWWRRRFGPNAPPSFKPEGWRSVKEGLPE